MLSILIVEDEEIIRTGLQFTIDWVSMDAFIIDTCENGRDGLEKIVQHSPDIVITDIKMPFLDGLSMVEQAYAQGFKFLTIILTSYSEFEYAKKSITLNVFEYLLKPLSVQKLRSVLALAKQRLTKEKELQLAEQSGVLLQTKQSLHNSLLIVHTEFSHPLVQDCLTIIKNDYKKNPCIEQIAHEKGVSPSYLSRIFKKNTTISFLDFLNRYRIQKSVELLVEQQYRFYEIAEMTGFSNYKQFHKIFKKYTGFSPSHFIKTGYCLIQ